MHYSFVEVVVLLDGFQSLKQHFLTSTHRIAEGMEKSNYARNLTIGAELLLKFMQANFSG